MNVKCADIIWLEAKLRECYSLNLWDYPHQRDLLVNKLNKLTRIDCHPKYGNSFIHASELKNGYIKL